MTQAQSDAGKAAESRFIRCASYMQHKGQFPPWLNFFCEASEKEDHNGIDAWAYTDVGKIPIQIKVSRKERSRFRRRKNRKHIPCVVVPPHTTFKVIFAETVKILSAERARILQARATQA